MPNFVLWILAEISIVACDIPEELDNDGAHMFYGNYRPQTKQAYFDAKTQNEIACIRICVRKLEFCIVFLALKIAVCFSGELGYAKPDAKEVLYGFFIPQLKRKWCNWSCNFTSGAMTQSLPPGRSRDPFKASRRNFTFDLLV
ncbi:hypothetical protein EZV62_017010 [Acer yangbiense]|uniref:Uncharacterized protein n=1 Tax=Acer yangbiense TaxID=1000413 RepID=A0A5C7HQ72_9ROSI|nr:hypothetical protein EZV62_017010 [Acer yangbiense]